MNSEAAKQRIRAQGITITEWACREGYPRVDVYRVLNGQYKGHYGKAHEIAVKLGLKANPDDALRNAA
ncbi:phage DNA-binding protein [Sulfuriferula multivorans]|uniref:Phage DNA-binding protein n=1 Tax=Sulfuriferula multivorans TaxID=1559896 RepID=A0A401JF48_9PROT|nr:DNA-binding protein [Sulfuriferula multivorans]GBL46236.1 phage DNA-binding protein [Sulfuriferula multivorans]